MVKDLKILNLYSKSLLESPLLLEIIEEEDQQVDAEDSLTINTRETLQYFKEDLIYRLNKPRRAASDNPFYGSDLDRHGLDLIEEFIQKINYQSKISRLGKKSTQVGKFAL